MISNPGPPAPANPGAGTLLTRGAPAGFFATEDKKEPLSDARKADQKAVDSKLLANIKKHEFLKPYLHARFTLTNSDKPHAMSF